MTVAGRFPLFFRLSRNRDGTAVVYLADLLVLRCTERRAPGTDGGRVISLVLQPVIGVMALSRRYKVMASARAVIWPVRRRLVA
jgi:hypothetical protein